MYELSGGVFPDALIYRKLDLSHDRRVEAAPDHLSIGREATQDVEWCRWSTD